MFKTGITTAKLGIARLSARTVVPGGCQPQTGLNQTVLACRRLIQNRQFVGKNASPTRDRAVNRLYIAPVKAGLDNRLGCRQIKRADRPRFQVLGYIDQGVEDFPRSCRSWIRGNQLWRFNGIAWSAPNARLAKTIMLPAARNRPKIILFPRTGLFEHHDDARYATV